MNLGVAVTSYMIAWQPRDAMEFLEHCHTLGAAGVQVELSGDLTGIRKCAEQYGMYVEAFLPLLTGSETGELEQRLRDAQAAGAVAIRAAFLESRRYETFHSLKDWHVHVMQCRRELDGARRLLDRYKIPLGIENHKDWTRDELVELMEQYGTEYLGVCLDFGNNISLLDDPVDVIERLAPYTVSTHLKDMAVQPCSDGFLLSEVLLGNGYVDLSKAISLVREARPKTMFSLEMITRDPLKVPCVDESFRATFPERSYEPTMQFVAEHASTQALPAFSHLSRDERLRLENDNVVACLRWAEENLS